ncbi:MAG: 2'-5' RNA ligase family protein [Actinomycetota bacterium]|nr:2'-5' RNA ligase family protein [Actinomycetota bacterium]
MRETALLIEVPEAEPLVGPWRERYDPVTARGIPAHITALWPFVPPPDLDAAVIERLRMVLADVKPFACLLAGVDEFPGVLWLRPEPDNPFRALTRALWTAFPEFPPYGGAFPDPQPHLTVGLANSPPAQAALHRELSDAFTGGLPVHCTMSSLTVFTSDDTGLWSRAHVLELGG